MWEASVLTLTLVRDARCCYQRLFREGGFAYQEAAGQVGFLQRSEGGADVYRCDLQHIWSDVELDPVSHSLQSSYSLRTLKDKESNSLATLPEEKGS